MYLPLKGEEAGALISAAGGGVASAYLLECFSMCAPAEVCYRNQCLLLVTLLKS